MSESHTNTKTQTKPKRVREKNNPLGRKPMWLRKPIDFGKKNKMDMLLKDIGLNTVCQEASCPNISECFAQKEATFFILGTTCTRSCTFCDVDRGKPKPIDISEADKLVAGAKALGLKHIVITSPTRDDLSDYGANHYANVVKHLKTNLPNLNIELLIPDFRANKECLQIVVDAKPNIIGHNIETIKARGDIRGEATYERSLQVLQTLKELGKNTIKTKSAMMVGLGESESEVIEALKDLRDVGCELLCIGQYLAPSNKYERVLEYVTPQQFERYKQIAYELGFLYVKSEPYARSSYLASGYLD